MNQSVFPQQTILMYLAEVISQNMARSSARIGLELCKIMLDTNVWLERLLE